MIDLHQVARLLGERIRTLRKKMGLKQAQFAQMVGMSRDAIGLMERGEKLPRLESICKIADNLNIPLSKLLDFDKTMQEEKKSGQDPLSSFNFYLKTKSPSEVQMLHDIAMNIFDGPAVRPKGVTAQYSRQYQNASRRSGIPQSGKSGTGIP